MEDVTYTWQSQEHKGENVSRLSTLLVSSAKTLEAWLRIPFHTKPMKQKTFCPSDWQNKINISFSHPNVLAQMNQGIYKSKSLFMFPAILVKQSQQQTDNTQDWMEDNFFFIYNFPLKTTSLTAMINVFWGECSQLDFSLSLPLAQLCLVSKELFRIHFNICWWSISHQFLSMRCKTPITDYTSYSMDL